VSSKCTVLHVDDNPNVLEVASDWAGVRDDITWLTASDPDAGSEILSTHGVDCLVSDSLLAADGEPFVTHAAETFPDLPIVLFTSMPHDALDPAVRESGVQYVKKGSTEPFDTLFDRILDIVDDSEPTADVAPRAARRDGGSGDPESDEQWEPIGRYRPGGDAELSTAIVSALEDYTGRDATDFPPLYDSVDADAMAALLRHPSGGTRDGVQIRFFYADHELAVTGDGLVLVRSD